MALLLPRSIFFHIPKTGGRWVREAIKRAGIVTREVSDVPFENPYHVIHCSPQYVRQHGQFSFTFVRHPLTWYKSFWVHKMTYGWDPENELDRRCHAETFVEFVTNCLHYHRGWMSDTYEAYAGTLDHPRVDFIGRQETLAIDLVHVLCKAGEVFNERKLLETPRRNEADLAYKDVAEYPHDLERVIRKTEARAMCQFGYF